MDYSQLLQRWRFSPSGDPMFQDETGEYFAQVMQQRAQEIGPEEKTRISKLIGWQK